MSDWAWWTIIGLVLIIIDVLSQGFAFSLVCLGIGAFGAAIAGLLDLSFVVQIASFSVVSLLSFFLVRPPLIRHLHKSDPNLRTNVDAVVGSVGRVKQTIDPSKGTGLVLVRGDNWSAESADGTMIESGSQVVVLKVKGPKVIVKLQPSE